MARGKMKIKAASTFGGCGLKKKTNFLKISTRQLAGSFI
jgi:hypothetical protein